MKFEYKLHPVSVGTTTRRTPYSPNTLNRVHWATRYKWKKAWQETTFWCTKHAKVPPIKMPHIVITVYANSLQDRDNTWASLKAIFDGIVQAGVMDNDDNDHCTMDVKQVKVKTRAEEGITITISKK